MRERCLPRSTYYEAKLTFYFDDVLVDGLQQRRRTGGYFPGSEQKVR